MVCNRGIAAQGVTQALRAEGVDAMLVEGGMRGWIGALQARPVDLGVDGLSVLQVQRPGRGCLSYVIAVRQPRRSSSTRRRTPSSTARSRPSSARRSPMSSTRTCTPTTSPAPARWPTHTGARCACRRRRSSAASPTPSRPLHDGDTIRIGAVTVRALALPGHTTDMTGLLIGDRALISGDSLFADGIARPDLQQGDPEGARAMGRTLHATLHDRVLTLGDDVDPAARPHPSGRQRRCDHRATLAAVRASVPELEIDDAGEFAEALLAEMPPRPANYETVIAVNAGTHPFDPELETGGNSCSTR